MDRPRKEGKDKWEGSQRINLPTDSRVSRIVEPRIKEARYRLEI